MSDFLKNTTVDLLEELKKSTTAVAEPETDFFEPENLQETSANTEETTQQNTADFSHDFDAEPIYFDFDREETERETEYSQALYDTEKLTDLIIDGTDILLQNTLPWLYKKTLNPEDKEALQKLAAKYRHHQGKKEMELSENDQETLSIYLDLEEYEKSLPLTPGEKKQLTEPLKEVLKKMNFQVTPESALLMAAAIISAPRFLPLAANMMNK
jgi:hypothetical protein